MDAPEILTTLKEAGAIAWIDGDKLLVDPPDRVPHDLIPEIRRCKAEIMALLPKPVPVAFDRPPKTSEEIVELIQYLADTVAFGRWFESLMARTDPAETSIEELRGNPCL